MSIEGIPHKEEKEAPSPGFEGSGHVLGSELERDDDEHRLINWVWAEADDFLDHVREESILSEDRLMWFLEDLFRYARTVLKPGDDKEVEIPIHVFGGAISVFGIHLGEYEDHGDYGLYYEKDSFDADALRDIFKELLK